MNIFQIKSIKSIIVDTIPECSSIICDSLPNKDNCIMWVSTIIINEKKVFWSTITYGNLSTPGKILTQIKTFIKLFDNYSNTDIFSNYQDCCLLRLEELKQIKQTTKQ